MYSGSGSVSSLRVRDGIYRVIASTILGLAIGAFLKDTGYKGV